MADPVNHDALSTTATVGLKAAKWGILGAIAAFAIPAVLIGGVGLLAGAGIAAMGVTGSIGGAIASLIGFAVGAAGVVGGIAAGTASAATVGGYAAAGGAFLGAAKGAGQVMDENTAYRNRGKGHEFTTAKKANDSEIKGIQQGYQIARADMEPVIQKREQLAFQKGQETVVAELQAHMDAQNTAMAKGAGQPVVEAAASKAAGFADKELVLKCESKAQAVIKQREVDAMAQKQV